MSNEKSPEKLDFKGFPGLASYAGDGSGFHSHCMSRDDTSPENKDFCACICAILCHIATKYATRMLHGILDFIQPEVFLSVLPGAPVRN